MKGENGSLQFGAMRACDRSHMNALYDALGDPDDYRAALVGADRMTRVEVGTVDPGSYAASLGLEQGDQVIQWGDQEVFEPADIRGFRRGLSDSDEPVTLVIFRPPGEIFEIETVERQRPLRLPGLRRPSSFLLTGQHRQQDRDRMVPRTELPIHTPVLSPFAPFIHPPFHSLNHLSSIR